MKITIKIDFGRHNYTDDAVDSVVAQAVGKPFHDDNAKRIGTVTGVKRIEGTKVVEFVMEPNIKTKGGETQNETV